MALFIRYGFGCQRIVSMNLLCVSALPGVRGSVQRPHLLTQTVFVVHPRGVRLRAQARRLHGLANVEAGNEWNFAAISQQLASLAVFF